LRRAAWVAHLRSLGVATARPQGQPRVLPARVLSRQDRRQRRDAHLAGRGGLGLTRRPVMNRVGIVAKPDASQARDVVERLIAWLEERGRSVVLDKETAGLVPPAPVTVVGRVDLPGQVRIVLLIMRSASSRIIEFTVAVDGQAATAYRSDGLIISTPTGSTAYSLSAGGPILFPTMDAVVITPICSHTLTNRPIVLPGTQRIELTLRANQEVMLTVDGQVGFGLREDDVVETQRAAARIRLVRFPHKHFFSVLRTKLKWGER